MARILVIDETAVMRDLYHDILSDEGHEVHLASRPILDLDQVEQLAPALLILGCLFENEPAGLVMVHLLRLRPTTAHIPLIMCTGALALLHEVRLDLEHQGITMLTKPFAVDDLVTTVEQALAARAQSLAAQ